MFGNVDKTKQKADLKNINETEAENASFRVDVLAKIRDAINDAGLEVNASLINDTRTTQRLIIKSNETGFEKRIVLNELNGSKLLKELDLVNNKGDRNKSSGTGGGFSI